MSAAGFDLFLCHNADEKPLVGVAAAQLLDEFSIRCWFDAWDLQPGADWNVAVEQALRACRACAIFLGPCGWGEAHLREAQAALDLAREIPDFKVIPVLLPGASGDAMAVLADFFSKTHYIELTGDAESLRRLALAVHGEAHGPPVMTRFTIRRDAQRWHTSGNAEHSLLYRGATLREAQQVAVSGTSDLGPAALAFLAASAEEEKRLSEREQTRNRRIIAVLSGMVLALAATTFFAVVQRRAAQRQASRALIQQKVAEEQSRVAEVRRRETLAEFHRASAANLMELGQRLYGDEPLNALRLTAEALVRVPASDKVLRGRILTSVREMTAAGRIAKVAVSAEKPMAVGDTDFFVVNEATGATLRRRSDGSIAARLPLKVGSVISDEEKPMNERIPYFFLKYGHQQQELRRKYDGSVVTAYSVKSVQRTGTPFLFVEYFEGPPELRRENHDSVPVELTASDAKIDAIEGARCFVVTYKTAPVEIRSTTSGKLIATLPGHVAVGVEGMTADRQVFAVAYGDNSFVSQGGKTLYSEKRFAIFRANGHRIELPEEPVDAAFDTGSSRYVLAYLDRNGEIRTSDSDTVMELPAPVGRATFVRGRLFVTYRNSLAEMRDRMSAVVAPIPEFVTVSAVPGTEIASVTYSDMSNELVDLRSGTRQPIGMGWGDLTETPSAVGPLQYFLIRKYSRTTGYSYEIRSAASGEVVLSSDVVATSPSTSWVTVVDGDHPVLFDLQNGRKELLRSTGVDHGSLTLGHTGTTIPNHPMISMQAWPGVPFFIIGSVPAQIRRIADGGLLEKLPAICRGVSLSPNGRLVSVECSYILHDYGNGTRLERSETMLYSTRTAHRILRFAGNRPIRYTAQQTFAFSDSTPVWLFDLRTRTSVAAQALQTAYGNAWIAVQYANTKSELWHDDGDTSTHGPAGHLPDGAVLIAADAHGRRLVVWEPSGTTLLIDADTVASFGRKPPETSDDALRAACQLLNSAPADASLGQRFAFGEPFRACSVSR